MAKAAKAVPDGYHTITPQLTLDNAAQTIDWYKKALGAEEVSRSAGPDGKIMHAELKIGNSRFMVNDVMTGARGPRAFGGSADVAVVRLRSRSVPSDGLAASPRSHQGAGHRPRLAPNPA